jgi:hypothetical protein
MSVRQMSIGLISVNLMSVDQMSVGLMVFDQKTRPHLNVTYTADEFNLK